MAVDSIENIKILDICFTGVFFAPLTEKDSKTEEEEDSEKLKEFSRTAGTFPDIEPYIKTENSTWVLDMQRLSKTKPFTNLFPPKAADQDLNALSRRIQEERPLGGMLRPFIDQEDDQFINGFGKVIAQPLTRTTAFSIPEEFCNALQQCKIYAVFNPDGNTFTWDFSELICQYEPNSVYDAYQRYAHARYSKVCIGAHDDPAMIQLKDLLDKGKQVLLQQFKKDIDWDLVENALQAFPDRDPYTPSTLESVVTDVLGQMKKRKRMGLHVDEQAIFDPTDESNIANAKNDLLKYVSEPEKEILKKAGLVASIIMLYRLISQNDDIRRQVDSRRITTINQLYMKMLIARPKALDLDAPFTPDDDNEVVRTQGKLEQYPNYPEPLEFLIEQEQRQALIRLFEEQFPGSKEFLNQVRTAIEQGPIERVTEEIDRYGKKGKWNKDRWFFKIYSKSDPEPKSHTIFSQRMRNIFGNIMRTGEEA